MHKRQTKGYGKPHKKCPTEGDTKGYNMRFFNMWKKNVLKKNTHTHTTP